MPLVRTDHLAEGPALLLTQYQRMPRVVALLRSYLKGVQQLEDMAWDVIRKRMLGNAHDAQLDVIGRIVGERRRGRDDATFELYILARIRINISHAHPDDVIEVLRLVDPARFRYRELYPHAILIEYLEPPAAPGKVLVDLAWQTRGGGVRIGVSKPPRANTFAFKHRGKPSNPLRGYGYQGNPNIGGVLSSRYEVTP